MRAGQQLEHDYRPVARDSCSSAVEDFALWPRHDGGAIARHVEVAVDRIRLVRAQERIGRNISARALNPRNRE